MNSMDDVVNVNNIWHWNDEPLVSSNTHSIYVSLPIATEGPPVSTSYGNSSYCWDKDHVRMPFSTQNLYPVTNEDGQTELKSRWELIHSALAKPITNSHELEKTILSYNSRYAQRWRFNGLHRFFNEVLEEEESEHFFKTILPKIIQLALQLPYLLPSSIPLLKKEKTNSITLSQVQISSLLANAFLCIFPRRNTTKDKSEYSSYPDINFNRLYLGHVDETEDIVSEKLKCICHYFRRVTSKPPEGVVTFKRQYLSSNQLPNWENCGTKLSNIKFHVTDTGTIESNGLGLLQVDFANKYVGGGILGRGSVQEEIRFAICTELIVTCLFTEVLQPTEALIVTGVEQYSSYEGYANTFKWTGDYQDTTPFDSFRRRKCYMVAIDALHFSRPLDQFKKYNMVRELNKAYSGFYIDTSKQQGQEVPAVATGNWGCGAFRGDPHLKTLLQLMACCAAGRNMVYFTFGNDILQDRIYNIHQFLVKNDVTIAQLWKHLLRFCDSDLKACKLYNFIYQSLNRKTLSNSVSSFFTDVFKKTKLAESNMTKSASTSEPLTESKKLSDNDIESMLDTEEELFENILSDDIEMKCDEDKTINDENNDRCHLDLLTKLDELEKGIKIDNAEDDKSELSSNENTENSNVVFTSLSEVKPSKRKITDYFGNTS